MKCFNHEDRDAVATCQNCGKALCKECAEKYTPCLCEGCAAAIQSEQRQREQNAEIEKRQKYRNALISTRGAFIRTCIYGVIVVVISLILCFKDTDPPMLYLGLAMMFCVPFGWKLLTYFQSFMSDGPFIIGSPIFWGIVYITKIVFSSIIGVPAFIFQLIKVFFIQRKINKTENQNYPVSK